MRRRINAWRRHWPSRGGHLVKSSTILVGGCIIVISVSLGIVLAFRLGFSAQDASFAAGLAALAMILLQTLAARSRERAEFQRGLDEMRRANAQALHEFDALGGQVRGLDELEARIGDLERRLEHGLAAELEGRIGAEIEAAKASMVSEMQVIEALVRQLAESILPLDAAAGAREPEPEEVPEPQPPASPNEPTSRFVRNGERFHALPANTPVTAPPNMPKPIAASILPIANDQPSVATVADRSAGPVIGDDSQNAITGASGTPPANNPAISGRTVTPQTGSSAPTTEDARTVQAVLPLNTAATWPPAPLAMIQAVSTTPGITMGVT